MSNYEYKNNKKPNLGSWPFWTVPVPLVPTYIIRMVLFVVLIPVAFGVSLSSIGLLINFLIIDYVIYLGIKKAFGLE